MDERMIITYVIIDLFCIILAITMIVHINRDFGNKFEVNSLHKSLSCFCGFLIFGLVWLLTENGYLPFHRAVIWIANMLSLFLMCAISYFWFLFVLVRFREKPVSAPTPLQANLARIPIAAAALLCVTSPLTGWVFTITADGIYQRGPFFLALGLIGYFYDLLILILAIWCRLRATQHEKRHQCCVVGLFILFPMLAGIIQFRLSGTPIMAPAIITALFVVFVSIQSSLIYNDALTGLNNRKRAYLYLEEQIPSVSADKPVVLYMLDVNSFKQINDRFGHIEGDHALKLFSDALLALCQQYHLFAARYGGDEFILVSGWRHPENPDDVLTALESLLAACCKEEQPPYELMVSCGYTVVSDPHESAEQALNRADQALYEKKRLFHSQL